MYRCLPPQYLSTIKWQNAPRNSKQKHDKVASQYWFKKDIIKQNFQDIKKRTFEFDEIDFLLGP